MRYLLLIFFLIAFNLCAEELSLEVSLDKDTLAVAEILEYKISLKGSFKREPLLEVPEFEDFKIISNRKLSRFNISKGKVVSSLEFIFLLSPLRAGTLEISGFKIKTADSERDIDALTVNVSERDSAVGPEKRESTPEDSKEKIWL
jgi:hypothetical protein